MTASWIVFVAAIVATLSLLIMWAIFVSNLRYFPRLGRVVPRATGPLVSILIPARNEAAVIAKTVRTLLDQTYQPIEVIVLDDHSTDATASLAESAAAGDVEFRLLTGAPLPSGWGGKNWACAQMAQAARGEWLVFTDADVRWQPDGIARVMGLIEAESADVLTVWPTQITRSLGERLCVPLMALVIHAYLPVWGVHHMPQPSLAAANGQCIIFRRRAYDTTGGHEAVRRAIVEDIQLARLTKAAGFRLRMADGDAIVRCRMYDSWAAVRDGFGKNILAGYGNSVLALLAATVFHWLVFLLPWVWLVGGGFNPVVAAWWGWPWWPLTLAVGGVGLRAATAWATRQRLLDAWSMPLSVLLMTRIAIQALWWHFRYGGPRWKGRTLTTA